MPPPAAKLQPKTEARDAFLKSLHTELHTASLSKQQTDGRVVRRRLNRVEYENTLHDLLGIDLPLQHTYLKIRRRMASTRSPRACAYRCFTWASSSKPRSTGVGEAAPSLPR
jgi:hypothetical protein